MGNWNRFTKDSAEFSSKRVKGYYLKELSGDRDKVISKAVECVYSYGELDLDDKIAIISGSSIKNRSNNSILEISLVKDIIGS